MAKKGAPFNNKNAAGNRGRLAGTVGGLFGPVGTTASGIYSGLTKTAVGQKSHNRSATLTGAAFGAITGALANRGLGARNIAIGTVASAGIGAGLNYAGAKLGSYIGKKGKRK